MKPNKMEGHSVKIKRLFNAPVNLLWSIWTEPTFVKQWFGSDENGTVILANIDLAVGGKYKISFMDSDGSNHTAFGEFIEIVPFSKLLYTWQWESELGYISNLQIDFIQQQENTLLVLEHFNLNPNSIHGHLEGWNGALDKIVKKILKM